MIHESWIGSVYTADGVYTLPVMAKRLRSIRVEDAEWASWTERARRDGMSVSDWIRDLCSRAAASGTYTMASTFSSAPSTAAVPARAKRRAAAKKRKRTEMCLHRRRPDEFCSRCD